VTELYNEVPFYQTGSWMETDSPRHEELKEMVWRH
jgi:hypothetical protein